jgi:hypothetical protein
MLTRLPCEIVAAVLRNLDSFRSLVSCLLSCRHVYSSLKESAGVEVDILRQQVTPALLPYAVATLEASLPSPASGRGAFVRELFDELYYDPHRLADRVRALSISQIRQMSRTHDLVHSFAMGLAADAWAVLCQQSPGVSGSSPVSAAEHFRFCRAFYRVELMLALSRDDRDRCFKACAVEHFLERQLSWEREQLGCVHDYMEKVFAQGMS